MTNSKDFNLFSYVFTKLYEEQFYEKDGIGFVFGKSKDVYSWFGILFWLKKEQYIWEFNIINVNDDTSVVAYKFNRQKQESKFDYIEQRITRKLGRYSLSIEPMGTLIEKKAYDEFEAQYNLPVEYIEKADRCLAELNKKIAEELAKATVSKKDDNGKKAA